MNYKRTWCDLRCAAGFAADCARIVLPHYKGARRSDVVAAIEIAERYAAGEEIDSVAVWAAAAWAADAADARAARAAAAAAAAAAAEAARAARAAADAAAAAAARAGADPHAIDRTYVRWVVRDLCGVADPSDALLDAARAAITADHEELIEEMINL